MHEANCPAAPLTQHASYHVGQAAFLRRQVGKPAMAYTRLAKPGAGAGTV